MINVYCDETAHLPRDEHMVMALGAIWCPIRTAREYSDQVRNLKRQHGLGSDFEVKWTKVSPSKVDFYLALVDFFFVAKELHFRGLVVPDKGKLSHGHFGQDHDTWYYKMYYQTLKPVIVSGEKYRIYLDIKDTRSSEKMRTLHQVLCNSVHDFDRSVIERVQTVRSHEMELLQLADLMIGALRHANEGYGKGSNAKDALVDQVRAHSGVTLTGNTALGSRKFNLLVWRPQEITSV